MYFITFRFLNKQRTCALVQVRIALQPLAMVFGCCSRMDGVREVPASRRFT